MVFAIGASALYAVLGQGLLQLSGVGTNPPRSWSNYALQMAGGGLIWCIVTGAVTSWLYTVGAVRDESRTRQFAQRLGLALLVGVLGAAVVYVLYDPGAFGSLGERMRRTALGTILMGLGLVLQALLVYAGAYASGAKLGPWTATRASARFFLSWRGLRLAFGVLLVTLVLNVLLRVTVDDRLGAVAFSAIVHTGLGLAALYVASVVWTEIAERGSTAWRHS